MNFPFYIASRYLISKKSHNVINIISWVSALGIAVGAMGLIIVLSVFNGFGNLIISLYDSFDPDIKITLKEGKTFDPFELKNEISRLKGVKVFALVLEETALLKYRDKQIIAAVKGVDENYAQIADIEKHIVEGSMLLQEGKKNYAVAGSGIAYALGINTEDEFNTLNIYIPKKGRRPVFNPEDAFTHLTIIPSGIFAIQQDFDSKYVIVPLPFARELIGEPKGVNAIEIALHKYADAAQVKKEIIAVAGNRFNVYDRLQQHEFLNRILNSEKWAVYLILSLILFISAFSIIGAISMLVIDKKRDIRIFASMGAEISSIRKIFFIEGLLISLIGGGAGIFIGGLICFIQQKSGLLKLGDNDTFIINAYPVSMELTDFINVFFIVLAIGSLFSWFVSYRLIKQDLLRV